MVFKNLSAVFAVALLYVNVVCANAEDLPFATAASKNITPYTEELTVRLNNASELSTSSYVVASGSCSVKNNAVKWTLYGSGNLMITGRGKMIDYEIGRYSTDTSVPSKAPWSGSESSTPVRSVTIGADVRSIGANAFSGCAMLESVSFVDKSVESIGKNAFRGCSSLKQIEIPTYVNYIGTTAFGECTALRDIYYDGYGANWFKAVRGEVAPETTTIHFKGNIYAADYLSQSNYDAKWELTMDGVLTISGAGRIPDYLDGAPWCGVPEVPVRRIIIGDDITCVGRNAFSDCSQIVEVKVPSAATSIEPYAFRRCTSLQRIDIPRSISFIGGAAFEACSELREVYYDGEKSDWEILDTGLDNEPLNNATIHYNSYPPYAFGGCGENATWVLDGDGILIIRGVGAMADYSPQSGTGLSIAPWRGATQKRIKRIIVEDGITTIGSYAFYYCPMAEVELPGTIVSIGKGALAGCANFTNIIYDGTADSWELVDVAIANNSLYKANVYYKRARLRGSVGVTGAIVTAIQINASGETLDVSRKMDGYSYCFPDLPIGRYTIRIEKDGFVSHEIAVEFHEDTNLPNLDLTSFGDINADGKVNATDMACLYEYLSVDKYGGRIIDDAYRLKVSDVNGDGTVSILDYQYLYCFIIESLH